jgi:hypothetical protein
VVILSEPTGSVLTGGVIIVGLAAGADVPTALSVIARRPRTGPADDSPASRR